MQQPSPKQQGAAEWLDQLQAKLKAGTKIVDDSTSAKPAFEFAAGAKGIEKNVPFEKRLAQEAELLGTRWNKLDGAGKGNVALWAAGAALSGLFALGAARNTMHRDQDGKLHMDCSQVLVTALQAVLAGGSLWMALNAVHTGSVGR